MERLKMVDMLKVLRKRGYWIVEATNEIVAVRPMHKARYPRFHLRIFPERRKELSTVDIHIDWERPKHSKYWGRCATAYGEAIKKEITILREEIRSLASLSQNRPCDF
ncbi:MAG: hypothetical protein ACE5IJ_00520 [Thermoplasmata archaeon]